MLDFRPSREPDPLSSLQLTDLPEHKLRVITAEPEDTRSAPGYAHVNDRTCQGWAGLMQPGCFLTLARGSDCVLSVRAASHVPIGCIALSEVQQHNLHALHGETYAFRVFVPPRGQPFELMDVDAEVRPLHADLPNTALEVDAGVLARTLGKQLLGRVIAVNEVVTSQVSGVDLVVRFMAADTLDHEARQEAISYHCYRGRVTPETSFWLTESRRGQVSGGTLASVSGRMNEGSGPPQWRLLNSQQRPACISGKHIINVQTADGEVFPVKRTLLRACIALTSALRSQSDDPPLFRADIDTLTFDRVLIFLEAVAMGAPPPGFPARSLDDLLQAARFLGLRSLEDYCRSKQGEMESRLKVYSFQEIVAENSKGACWLILDGMVLDVTRWLPQHPGGTKIIPAQALNMDCSRFFEVFHASRESFLYLKEFYIGELHPQERSQVPCNMPPSEDFLQQLREYTSFRMPVAQECHGRQKIYRSF